jgi:methylated-DNA-[protein]-cysteine S-methyltransferase
MTNEDHGRTCWARIASPVGELLLVGDAGARVALRGIWFAAAAHAGRARALAARAREDRAALADVVAQLERYFTGELRAFDVALAPDGTPFQRAVWSELSRIPYGATATYADVARAIGTPRAVRAVGAANGRNPISIVVPCHRVVGHDGRLTGYAGGIAQKEALLALERRALPPQGSPW